MDSGTNTIRVKYQTLKELEAEWASSKDSIIGAQLIKRYSDLGRVTDPTWKQTIGQVVEQIARQCIEDPDHFSSDDIFVRLALLEVSSALIPIDAKIRDMATQKKSALYKQDPVLENEFNALLRLDVPSLCEEMMGL